jgi:hypothetical protein
VWGFFSIETATATELSPMGNILAIAKTGHCGEILCRPDDDSLSRNMLLCILSLIRSTCNITYGMENM